MLMWQIPVCGFGGVSQVEVMNARSSTSGSWIDMGEASALSLFRTTHNLGDRTCSRLILSREGLGMRLGIHTRPGLVLLHLWHVDER